MTSHQIRGLVVQVRLLKLIRGLCWMWPSLVAGTDRYRWIKYNMDMLDLPKEYERGHFIEPPLDSDDDDNDVDEVDDEGDPERYLLLDDRDPLETEFD